MAYAVGDTITTSEYNGLLTNTTSSGTPPAFGINHIFGTGALQYGLGQTELSSVAVTDTIQAAQWNSLFTAMDNVANHTNDTLTSTTAKSAGDTIAIISALAADLNTLAASVAAGSPNATAVTTTSDLQTTSSSTATGGGSKNYWNGSHVVEHTVTFTNANQARWFFNAGGQILINVTRTAGAASFDSTLGGATSKDQSMDELITGLGTFALKSQTSTRSGPGETTTGSDLTLGFYDLTDSYQTICKITQDSGTYSANMYIQIEAKADAAVSGGTATVVTIKTSLVDDDLGDSTYDSTAVSAGNPDRGPATGAFENFVGTTNVILKTNNPTTAQGLATVYTPSATAAFSNVVTNYEYIGTGSTATIVP
jgi:hypothetical protein